MDRTRYKYEIIAKYNGVTEPIQRGGDLAVIKQALERYRWSSNDPDRFFLRETHPDDPLLPLSGQHSMDCQCAQCAPLSEAKE